jgi:uncharacterized membrane protein
MGDFKVWPVIGLAYGTVLGLAAGFGGFGAFLLVLFFGVVGFLAGRVIEGELDVSGLFGSTGRDSARRRPS